MASPAVRFASRTRSVTRAANDRVYADGIEAWHRGDLQAALALLRRAVAQDPQYAPAISALGAVLSETGRTAEARLLHQRTNELTDTVPAAARTALEARYHASIGDWPRAIEGFASVWNRRPDQVSEALELAHAQFRARRTADARGTLAAMSRLAEGADSDARVLLLSARIAGQFGEMAQVRELAARAADVAKARDLRLVHGRAKMLEAGAAQNLGELDEAVRLRQEAKAICESIGDWVCASTAFAGGG